MSSNITKQFARNTFLEGSSNFPQRKGDRWLNDQALGQLLRALDNYPTHSQAFAIKILLLTGARLQEVLTATWDQFDLEKGVWIKPSRLTQRHAVPYLPMAEQALQLLRELRALRTSESPYLFPGRTGSKPIKDINYFWKKVTKERGLQEFHIHDLRNTYATHLFYEGVNLSVIGKLIEHKTALHRYDHFPCEVLRKATGVFGNKLKTMRLGVAEADG